MRNFLDKFFICLGVLLFNLIIGFVLPLMLLTILINYISIDHWIPWFVQILLAWLSATIITILLYYGGNRLLAYSIGRRLISPQRLHQINAAIIYTYIALFALSVYLTN